VIESENTHPDARGTNTSVTDRAWVLVCGTGGPSISREETELAQEVGHALALAGMNLQTGGWEGVDATVTAAFARH